jgi:hypothetical protein
MSGARPASPLITRILLVGAASMMWLGATAARASAQTDYYNTDRGRPVQIEDAYAAERYAVELKLAPVRAEWVSGSPFAWGVEPEIAYGVLPRTHFEIGVPVLFVDAGSGSRQSGVAGLELSFMHNFNAETQSIPALGVRADVLAPVGKFAPQETYVSFTGMVTRTYSAMRVHINGQYTVGSAPVSGPPASRFGPRAEDAAVGTAEVGRWLAGIAVDKTFPLSSMLLTADLFARQPIVAAENVEVIAGAGLRLQTSPNVALDLGGGHALNGDDRAWHVTFGLAYAFGIRGLMSGAAR